MRNARRTIRRATLGIPLVVAGCGLFDEPAPPVILAIHAPPSARLGDSVEVRLIIENRASFPVIYQGNMCPRFFRVVDSSGEDAGPPFMSILCPAIDIPRTLAAREQHEYVSYWQTRTHPPRPEPIVRTGSYHIEPVVGINPAQEDRLIDIQRVVSTIIVVE